MRKNAVSLPDHRFKTQHLIPSSGMSISDLTSEAMAGLFARPQRMLLTVFGTVLGLGALVATIGLSRTAGNRIVGRFDALAATEIVVTPKPTAATATIGALPWDAPQRVGRLNGVVSVGNLSTVNVGPLLVAPPGLQGLPTSATFKLTVAAASPGLFRVVHAELRSGRFINEAHAARFDRVAVLGPNAALRLGISVVDRPTAITIGDDVFVVIGVLDSVLRQPELLGSVIIPETTAQQYYRLKHPGYVVVETQIGAAHLISQQIPLALRPDNPRSLRVVSPPEPRRVREEVKGDLNILFFILGGVSLLVGAVGIANVTLMSVMERTGEIGLRRALGASRRHVAQQFLLESSTLGFMGGILGASVGTLVVIGVSAHQSWTPVLDVAVPLLAPIVGGLTGLVSGTYPAIRASQLNPVDALRSGT
jgi:macrolide transport system ATP-binding/permease protein